MVFSTSVRNALTWRGYPHRLLAVLQHQLVQERVVSRRQANPARRRQTYLVGFGVKLDITPQQLSDPL